MNPFYHINKENSPLENKFQLAHMGTQRVFLTVVPRKSSEYWGTPGRPRKDYYRATTAEDYDQQFIERLKKWKPVYTVGDLLDYHHNFYVGINPDSNEFLLHMRYVIFPKISDADNPTPLSELFQQWIDRHFPVLKDSRGDNSVYNTIHVGTINAPTQLQQHVTDSLQTQNNALSNEMIEAMFELIRSDIRNMSEQIKNDFDMEINYALAQLSRHKDIKSQLSRIGDLITQVGIGVFSGLLASPAYDLIKPHLGLH